MGVALGAAVALLAGVPLAFGAALPVGVVALVAPLADGGGTAFVVSADAFSGACRSLGGMP